MNDTTNKEKQFDAAGKRRIVIDGIPYTVMVFFRSDVKETGKDKLTKEFPMTYTIQKAAF